MDDIRSFFDRVSIIPELIESKTNEIKRLHELAYSLSAVDTSGERVQQSRNIACKYAELIDKAADLELELLDDKIKLLDYQRVAGRAIDQCSMPDWIPVLRDLFIEGLPCKTVARKRHYSERQIQNIKNKFFEECTQFHSISWEKVL